MNEQNRDIGQEILAGLQEIKRGEMQEGDSALLNLDRIFNSNEFVAEGFPSPKWLEDGTGYTLLELPDAGQEIVQIDAKTGSREILATSSQLIPAGETAPLQVKEYSLSKDCVKLLIFTNTNHYWVLNRSTWNLHKLGNDSQSGTLMNAAFSPDGQKVAYVSQSNLFTENLISGQRIQLTKDGSDITINGNLAGLYSGLNTRGFRWSPDGSHIAYVQFDTKEVKDFYLLNNTDSLYSKIIPFQHVKPGAVLPACHAGFVSASGGETIWIDTLGDPRNHYITQLCWTPDSKNVVIQQLNRRQNTINVMFVERNTGLVQTVLTDSDETWLEPYDLHWIKGGKEFTWISERDGWRHVYLASREGGALKLLTDGSFDVLNIQAIDENRGWLYYIASPENPTQRYLYRVGLDGSSTPVRVTPQDLEGTHGYLMPLDSQWAFHTYSTFDTPPVVHLIKLHSHEIVRKLVDNSQLLEKLKPLKRQPTEFFRVNIGEGVELDGWCMKPADFDPEKRYPVLFHVYGMPANQTVLDQWNGFRYLWHLMLTQLGYIVMSLDNRGTPAPRGRAWRKIIYRKHGILPAADQATAVRTLIAQRPYVDAERIGVYGWSGGGCVSLHLIFQYPDLYKVAMPGAGLSHHKFYTASFTERFLGLPQDNPEDYENTAPLNMVENLKGDLLLIHGTGDNNVHYQSTEALIEKLVNLNKRFTMMAYPNGSHGLGSSRATQRHLYDLYTWYLSQNLPAGPR